MRVFLSWSGERSRAVATALREWLPDVLHFVQPWLSSQDITAGQRWLAEVSRFLDASHFGVLCITPENAAAPWLNFEAGALSRSLAEGTVVPYLLDLQFQDIVSGPLSQFQAQKVDRDGTYALVCAINGHHEQPIEAGRLRRHFDHYWPDLEQALSGIRGSRPPAEPRSRSQPDLLEEIVSELRSLRLAVTALQGRETQAPSVETLAALGQRVPVQRLREHARRTVEQRSLRLVARDVSMSPMGLRRFIVGEGTPAGRTLRHLRAWYVRDLLSRGGAVPPDGGIGGPPPGDTPDQNAA